MTLGHLPLTWAQPASAPWSLFEPQTGLVSPEPESLTEVTAPPPQVVVVCPTKYVCPDDAFHDLCTQRRARQAFSQLQMETCIHHTQCLLQAAPGPSRAPYRKPKFKCHQGPLQETRKPLSSEQSFRCQH